VAEHLLCCHQHWAVVSSLGHKQRVPAQRLNSPDCCVQQHYAAPVSLALLKVNVCPRHPLGPQGRRAAVRPLRHGALRGQPVQSQEQMGAGRCGAGDMSSSQAGAGVPMRSRQVWQSSNRECLLKRETPALLCRLPRCTSVISAPPALGGTWYFQTPPSRGGPAARPTA